VSSMNPIDVAWLVLKAPLEGSAKESYDSCAACGRDGTCDSVECAEYLDSIGIETNRARTPQQPTLTDFMGYTRPQLEQLLIMFQNELVRRGHASGTSEVNVPNRDDYMTGSSMSEDEIDASEQTTAPAPIGRGNVEELMTRLMAGETLSREELTSLQTASTNEHNCPECSRPLDSDGDCTNEACSNYWEHQYGQCEDCGEHLDEDRDCTNVECENYYENHY